MAIYRGENEVAAVYRGTTAIERVYRGDQLVWEAAGSDLPQFTLTATAADYSALTGWAGDQPTVSGGVLQFTTPATESDMLRGPVSIGANGGYAVIAVRATTPPSGAFLVTFFFSTSGGFWYQDDGAWGGGINTYTGSSWYAIADSYSATAGHPDSVGTDWDIVEVWNDTTAVRVRVNGATIVSATPSGYTPKSYFYFFDANGGGVYEIAAIGIVDGVPDEAGMTAARDWAAGFIP